MLDFIGWKEGAEAPTSFDVAENFLAQDSSLRAVFDAQGFIDSVEVRPGLIGIGSIIGLNLDCKRGFDDTGSGVDGRRADIRF